MLGTYRPIFNKFCEGHENKEFLSLHEAEVECLQSGVCTGLFDNCGEHKSFYLCNQHNSHEPSRCGSILYLPPGKSYLMNSLIRI